MNKSGSSPGGRSHIENLKKHGKLPLPVGPELDEHTKYSLDQILEDDEAAMQITSPYGGEKVSTRERKMASLNPLDERSVDYAIRELGPDVNRLKLSIKSPGGRTSTANKISQALINNFDEIEVYVPHEAKSGGTLISLAGDRIVMGEMSDLGPIDPQKGGRYSTTDLQEAYHRWLSNWSNKHPDEASAPEKSMMERMDILEYEQSLKSTEMIMDYASNILSNHDLIDEHDAKDIAGSLVGDYPVHGYTVTAGEAQSVLPEEMILEENERADEMGIIRDWMDQYAFDSSKQHAVVYHPGDTE